MKTKNEKRNMKMKTTQIAFNFIVRTVTAIQKTYPQTHSSFLGSERYPSRKLKTLPSAKNLPLTQNIEDRTKGKKNSFRTFCYEICILS